MGEKVIDVKKLSVSYFGNEEFKVEGVDFYLEKGEVLGIIGKNGAGKTTLLKSIACLKGKDGGEISINGFKVGEENKEIKDSIGYVSSEWIFNMNMKTGRQAKCLGNFYSDFSYSKYEELSTRLGIKKKANPTAMSAGEKIKFSLAFAISHNAKLLIMDEPLSLLDPVSRDEVMDLLREIIEEGQTSIIYSTHMIHELEKIADRIIYLDNGRQRMFADVNEIQDRYFKGRRVDLEELFEMEELNWQEGDYV